MPAPLLPLPAVSYDVLGPNPFDSEEDIDHLITTVLGPISSSSISSVLEQFILSLDTKARLDLSTIWQAQRAQEQDEATGRSKLPNLPVPFSGVRDTERAVGRRRARILKDGALSMIVFGYDEKLIWAQRIGSFIRSMRAVLGDRSLQTRWGGSVLDSVIGTFLTQNASDVLSSRAFLTLAGRFPSRRYKRGLERSSGKEPGSDDTPLSPDVPHELTPGEEIVDWDAVRTCPDPMQLVDAIRCRGMYFLLAGHITKCLNKVHREGGRRPTKPPIPTEDDNTQPLPTSSADAPIEPSAPSADVPSASNLDLSAPNLDSSIISMGDIEDSPLALDGDASLPLASTSEKISTSEKMSLEWLRSSDVTDEEVWSYLMSIEGLGRKSTACIMLLTLGRKEFPVDVHVARVCARIGWLPIIKGDPDPKEVEQYPEDPEVHK